jgi:DNA-binding MarR family transcriptional regulator
MRQMGILLTIYRKSRRNTVRALAERLGVTKPVITRALDTMGRMGLVTRRRDPHDKRNVVIQRTVDGTLFSTNSRTVFTQRINPWRPDGTRSIIHFDSPASRGKA